MIHTYKYRFDRRTLYWTALYVVVYIGLGYGLYRLYAGEYLSAWFISCVGALLILMALSIPRKLVVTDASLEIRCLLDITELRRDEIVGARRVEADEMRWLLPLFGGCGFFGYYGHFFDLRMGQGLNAEVVIFLKLVLHEVVAAVNLCDNFKR